MMQLLWGVRHEGKVNCYVVPPEGMEVVCGKCGGSFEEEEPCIHYYNTKLTPMERVFCVECYDTIDIMYHRLGNAEKRACLFSSEIPKKSYRIMSKVGISYTGRTVSEVMDDPKVPVEDHTVYAGRPGYILEGDVRVGKAIEELEREAAERLAAIDEDPMAYLESEMESPHFIEGYTEEERRRLEHNDG